MNPSSSHFLVLHAESSNAHLFVEECLSFLKETPGDKEVGVVVVHVNFREIAYASWAEDEFIDLFDLTDHVVILTQSQGCYFELEVTFFSEMSQYFSDFLDEIFFIVKDIVEFRLFFSFSFVAFVENDVTDLILFD